MRISDWSSDVCSSDLIQYEHVYPPGTDAADLLVQMQLPFVVLRQVPRDVETEASPLADGLGCHERREHPLGAVFGNARAVVLTRQRLLVRVWLDAGIGRASWRARVGQYV